MKEKSPIYDIAHAYSEETSRAIFLTGKAGTGKTTFLRNLRTETHKQMVVAAPTGIAAINAEGVTLHSFFQLPLTPFVPTPEGKRNLIQKIKIRGNKRKMLQQLEILVIDEISMVRADILDEVDTILRHFRYRNEPFGGVQMLYIGDLYQLPPVTLPEEWNLLSQFYKTPYFFDSYAVREQPPIYIELNKIFRQKDGEFIQLLNEVRNNQLSEVGYNLLKSRYQPDFKLDTHKDYILLTTHNAKAARINQEELNNIKARTYTYKATVHGEFPERNFPNDEELTLKKDARVMFIANDTEFPRRYYNGKLGTISNIDENHIYVKLDDEEAEIPVKLEIWKNIRYNLNHRTGQIEEEELGSYMQYPLRLAWAITIHKSQGLTFDKAIIDAEDSFTSGQVYVALSRCRNLDGLVLSTPIFQDCLSVDPTIVDFSQNKCSEELLQSELHDAQNEYWLNIITSIYNFQRECALVNEFVKFIQTNKNHINSEGQQHAKDIQQKIFDLQSIGYKFTPQLKELLLKDHPLQLKRRLKAAAKYFEKEILSLNHEITNTPAEIDDKETAKEYKEHLKLLFGEIALRKELICGIVTKPTLKHYYKIRDNFRIPSFTLNAQNKLKAADKKGDKTPSAQISYELYKKGKSIEEIAEERQMTESTISTHLLQYVSKGNLPLTDFVEEVWIDAIEEMLDCEGITATDIFNALEGNVSYWQIRMVKARWKVKNEK